MSARTSEPEPMAYAGYCGDCGGMVAAVVDEPDPKRKAQVRRDVASFMRNGLDIQRVSCQHVRENLRGCRPTCACKSCQKRGRVAAAPSSESGRSEP